MLKDKNKNTDCECAIRAVGFDFDGTLFDTSEAIVASFADTSLEFGVSAPSEQTLVPLIGHSLTDIINELEFKNFPVTTVIDTYRRHHANHIPKISSFEGVRECLQKLKRQGFQIAIVTTRYSQSVDLILKINGFDPSFFDCVIAGDMCENLKPHPEPLLRAMNHLKIKPNEFCYVGDRAVDRDAALAAGVQFVAVGWGSAPFEETLPAGSHRCDHPERFFLIR